MEFGVQYAIALTHEWMAIFNNWKSFFFLLQKKMFSMEFCKHFKSKWGQIWMSCRSVMSLIRRVSRGGDKCPLNFSIQNQPVRFLIEMRGCVVCHMYNSNILHKSFLILLKSSRLINVPEDSSKDLFYNTKLHDDPLTSYVSAPSFSIFITNRVVYNFSFQFQFK